ncbi:MAG: class I SAM-dependent methyltransferase, partial [Thermoanaerobaculia bacterium]
MSDQDQYSRALYRHMIAWPERIRREAPLLERVLRDGPSNRILDLGSGPGDHAQWLASIGFDVVGVDSSESMLRMAAEEPVPANVRFVQGDFRDLEAVVDGSFGGAICLGNALPHLTEESDLRALASGLAAKLETGAKAVFQMLNYDRIAATGERALPVNVRDDPDGEGEL